MRMARRGERRFELETGEFAPPEKARMQKAISVHQTCSLYPYTEMARARETNSTTSLHNTPRCELRALERTPIAEHGMRAASATQDARRIENLKALW